MIIITLSIILFFIFMVLGGFHFYWLFGGVWGLAQVIPTKGTEPNSLAIPKFATLLVALVLLSFGFLYFAKSGLVNLDVLIPKSFVSIISYGYWIIPCIFIARAIGEFKYVGFFKKIKHTEFAKADSKIFVPLCLGIGIAGLVIQLIG